MPDKNQVGNFIIGPDAQIITLLGKHESRPHIIQTKWGYAQILAIATMRIAIAAHIDPRIPTEQLVSKVRSWVLGNGYDRQEAIRNILIDFQKDFYHTLDKSNLKKQDFSILRAFIREHVALALAIIDGTVENEEIDVVKSVMQFGILGKNIPSIEDWKTLENLEQDGAVFSFSFAVPEKVVWRSKDITYETFDCFVRRDKCDPHSEYVWDILPRSPQFNRAEFSITEGLDGEALRVKIASYYGIPVQELSIEWEG